MNKASLALVLLGTLLHSSAFGQQTLTLEASKKYALENNVKIKNSELAVQSAKAVSKSAFTNYFPTVSAGALMVRADKNLVELKTEGGNLPVYDGNPVNLMNPTQFAYLPGGTVGMLRNANVGYINVIQPVFTGGRIINGNKLSELGVAVSEKQSKLAREEVLLKTEEQFWLLLSLREKMKTVEKYEQLLQSLKHSVDDAYQSGVVMKNDVLKVQLKLNEVKLNKFKLENGIRLSGMAFCQYIGIPYNDKLEISGNLQIQAAPDELMTDHTEALSKRNEFKLLNDALEAEKLQTRLKLGEFLPQAGVGVSGATTKVDKTKKNFGIFFGTVAVPISGWWSGAYQLEERAVKEKIAENTLQDNSQLLTLQMQKSWQELSNAYKEYEVSNEALRQAEENARVNADSYKNGMITVADLLEAQALLQQAKEQVFEASSGYKVKTAEYLMATGRLQ